MQLQLGCSTNGTKNEEILIDPTADNRLQTLTIKIFVFNFESITITTHFEKLDTVSHAQSIWILGLILLSISNGQVLTNFPSNPKT